MFSFSEKCPLIKNELLIQFLLMLQVKILVLNSKFL